MPNVIYELVAGGLLAAAFLPVYMLEKERGGEKSGRRAAIADPDVRLFGRKDAAGSDDARDPGLRIEFRVDAKRAERVEHDAGVFGVERARKNACAVGERR